MRFATALSFAMIVAQTAAGQSHRRPMAGQLKVGDAAPKLSAVELRSDKEVRLADLRGKPVVLIFGSCT